MSRLPPTLEDHLTNYLVGIVPARNRRAARTLAEEVASSVEELARTTVAEEHLLASRKLDGLCVGFAVGIGWHPDRGDELADALEAIGAVALLPEVLT